MSAIWSFALVETSLLEGFPTLTGVRPASLFEDVHSEKRIHVRQYRNNAFG